jgi:hypothetical protein
LKLLKFYLESSSRCILLQEKQSYHLNAYERIVICLQLHK